MKEKRFAHENLPADIQAKADAMNPYSHPNVATIEPVSTIESASPI